MEVTRNREQLKNRSSASWTHDKSEKQADDKKVVIANNKFVGTCSPNKRMNVTRVIYNPLVWNRKKNKCEIDNCLAFKMDPLNTVC